MTWFIWATAAIACCLGWAVVWQEVSAPAEWRYRIGLVTLWASVTWVVASWPLL